MESDYKTVNRSLRHLSAELTLTRAHMQMRQREGDVSLFVTVLVIYKSLASVDRVYLM